MIIPFLFIPFLFIPLDTQPCCECAWLLCSKGHLYVAWITLRSTQTPHPVLAVHVLIALQFLQAFKKKHRRCEKVKAGR